jgi:hypothetical protein
MEPTTNSVERTRSTLQGWGRGAYHPSEERGKQSKQTSDEDEAFISLLMIGAGSMKRSDLYYLLSVLHKVVR